MSCNRRIFLTFFDDKVVFRCVSFLDVRVSDLIKNPFLLFRVFTLLFKLYQVILIIVM